MSDTVGVQPGTLSRRTILLRGVSCAAGAAALIGPVRNAQAAKMPQTSPVVVYQSTPKDSHQCDGCLLFQAPNSCQVVDGVVSPSGWCKLWAKKAG
jgi:High potential iron-sulfur protein